MATGNLEEDFGRESKRFTDTISKFTEQTSGVTQSITKFVKASKLSGDTLEKFSGSLKTQLENLSSNIDGLSDEIFKSDKPFLVDTQKLNEKIGVAQATIDVLSAKLQNSGNEFVQLTESEKEVVKQQIAAAKQLVDQTQAFGFGARQVLAQLQTRTLSSVEDFTLSQISRVPIIGPFFSGFISDTIKILRTRRIERAKAAKETLLQEAKEKAQRESDIDFLVKSGAVKDRQEAERRLLQERENNIKQERINAELEQLKQFKERGLISDKQFKENTDQVSAGKLQDVKVDESNADDVVETVNLSETATEQLKQFKERGLISDKQFKERGLISDKQFKENTDQVSAGKIQDVRVDESNADDFKESVNLTETATEQLGDSFKSGVVEGTSSAITTTLLPGFRTALMKTIGFLLFPLKLIALGIKKLITLFRKPDTSRLKETKKIKPGFDTSGDKKDKEEKSKSGRGLLGALGLAGLAPKTTALGGLALGTGVGGGVGIAAALSGLGIGLGGMLTGIGTATGISITSDSLKELGEDLAVLLPQIERAQNNLNEEKLISAGNGLKLFGDGLSEFAGGSFLQVFKNATGLGGFFSISSLKKIEMFSFMGDDLRNTGNAFEELTPKLEKFFNMMNNTTIKNFDDFVDFSENFKKGSKNINQSFKGGYGLENIDPITLDKVKELINSVSNLARVNAINQLTSENAMLSANNQNNTQPVISTSMVNQNNNQGFVISKNVNNDNLDTKILSYG